MTNANLAAHHGVANVRHRRSGSLNHMLGRSCRFSAKPKLTKWLVQPDGTIIIVFLRRTLIGGIVVSMYLPIFKLGQGRLMLLLDALSPALALILSLLIGSFLNVVIYRVPKMMDTSGRESQMCRKLNSVTAQQKSSATDAAFTLLKLRSFDPLV
jgi:hypothetical protein